jgi:hypothetical protein
MRSGSGYLERYHFEAVLAIQNGVKVAHVSCIFGEDVLTIEPKSFTPSSQT